MAMAPLRYTGLSIGLVICALFILHTMAGPWCFKCTDDFHPLICQKVIQCGDHEKCHTEASTTNNGASLYTTTCKADQDCTTRIRKRAVSRRTTCSECCTGTLCNAEGCNATQIRTPGRLFCLKCDFVQNPADCDLADLCSLDEVCHISIQQRFGLNFYKLGCFSKTACPPPSATLANDKAICCDSDLCNSNDLGINPSVYTTTPVPTTRLPSKPTATFATPTLVYNVTHAANETMDLVCNVTGGPVPNVNWTFSDGNNTIIITQGISTGPTGFESILSIPNPDKTNSGTYTCQADNANGKAEDKLDMTVLEPPYIQNSSNQTINLQMQDDITIPCKVLGDNSTTVKWNITANVRSYTINADNSLTVHNVHAENTGDYVCTAENADGKSEKRVHLIVNDTSSSATAAPCTCPTAASISTCPTAQSTTPTAMTQTTTSSATTQSTTTPTTPTTTTTSTTQPVPVTTPSTTTTTTPTTTSTPTTTTTTTTTTPTTTSTPTTTTTTTTAKPLTSPTTANQFTTPSSSPPQAIPNQFQDAKAFPVTTLQCPTANAAGVTWHRLVQDFNHTDPSFIDTHFGVLNVVSQATVLSTGVYECRVGHVPVAQLVIYDKLPNPVHCHDAFGQYTITRGTVVRATCGPCANTLGVRPNLQLTTADTICESAIAKKIIPAYGGDVTYLVQDNNQITILDGQASNILVH